LYDNVLEDLSPDLNHVVPIPQVAEVSLDPYAGCMFVLFDMMMTFVCFVLRNACTAVGL